MRKDLGLEVVGFAPGEDDDTSQHNTASSNGESEVEIHSKITQRQFNKIVDIACQDNLDFCCKLTKNEVTEKAKRSIRNDPAILTAVEQRKVA